MNMTTRAKRPSAIQLLNASNPNVLAVAHRGSWRHAPENSLAALEDAIALGADVAEIDVQATADGALLLLHDETLDRTTDVCGKLASMNVAEVHGIRLKPRDGIATSVTAPDWKTDSLLPTLGSALEAARGRILLNIDLKGFARAIALADQVSEVIIAAGMAEQIVMKSNVEGDIDEFIRWVKFSRFFGRIAFMPVLRSAPGALADDMARLAVLGAPMYEVNFNDFSSLYATRDELSRQGARAWVNTLHVSHNMDLHDEHALEDPDAVWGELSRTGVVGAIQTDAVAPLLDFLNARGYR